MTKDEALKLALEALESTLSDNQPYIVKCGKAITAIKEALAQPVQEPVAWITTESAYRLKQGGNYNGTGSVHAKQTYAAKNPLYAAPPKRPWVGLTDEDMNDPRTHNFDFIYGVRWAEAKFKEKNT